jgi:hypothetical protein
VDEDELDAAAHASPTGELIQDAALAVGIQESTSITGHSRVYSSTIVRQWMRRPSAQVS